MLDIINYDLQHQASCLQKEKPMYLAGMEWSEGKESRMNEKKERKK